MKTSLSVVASILLASACLGAAPKAKPPIPLEAVAEMEKVLVTLTPAEKEFISHGKRIPGAFDRAKAQAALARIRELEQSRAWSNEDGEYHLVAIFLTVEKGVAKLKKMDGTTASVRLLDLSENDKSWIRAEMQARAAAVAKAKKAKITQKLATQRNLIDQFWIQNQRDQADLDHEARMHGLPASR